MNCRALTDYQSRVISGINEADELINSPRVPETYKLWSIISERNEFHLIVRIGTAPSLLMSVYIVSL